MDQQDQAGDRRVRRRAGSVRRSSGACAGSASRARCPPSAGAPATPTDRPSNHGTGLSSSWGFKQILIILLGYLVSANVLLVLLIKLLLGWGSKFRRERRGW